MSKLYFSFPVLLLFCSLQTNWKSFTSEKGKFTVLTPGEFTEKINTTETAIGKTEYHTFLYQSEDDKADNLVYMVSYCDYPEGAIHSDSTELLKEFFEVTVESALKSVKGELFYSSEIKLGEYPGMLWRINYQKGTATIKTKSYLVGRRYYSIQTVTYREKGLNPLIDKFLNSFKLIE
jgi:hypothetical protein